MKVMKVTNGKVIENCSECGNCTLDQDGFKVCTLVDNPLWRRLVVSEASGFKVCTLVDTPSGHNYYLGKGFPDWCPLPDQAPPTPKKPEPVRPLAPRPKHPNPLKTQVGGDHYKSMAIQPVEFIVKNNIGFIEGCIIKYACRWKSKNGIEDLKKIIHFTELLITLNEKG